MSAITVAGSDRRPGPADVPRPPDHPARGLALPDVLLLDEGGVLSLSGGGDGAAAEVAIRVGELVARAGIQGPGVGRIEADIRSAKDTYRRFKARHLADPHPAEMDHRTFWSDLVAASWPDPARMLVRLESEPLSNALSAANLRQPAPGALDLLAWAVGRGIRIGLVANTFAAAATRTRLARWGMDRYLSVQVHSAEIGHRKPDPTLLTTAITALRAEPARCWYVGDSRAKDVECARRSGVATAVLVGGGGSDDRGPNADLDVGDCAELHGVLRDLADAQGSGAGRVAGEHETGKGTNR